MLAGACAEAPAPPSAPRASGAEQLFLLPPSRGYPGDLDAELAASVDSLHRRLLAEGAALELRRVVDALVRERPGAAPAQVLMAQVEVVAGDADAAARRLGPVVEEWPAYDAALLLLGHVGERLNDLPTAFDAYRRIAQSVPSEPDA